jgi:eukaryotic-like serine/threonine-protein kinase
VSEMELRWGKRFGRYEIIAELGRGAMGIVYKARDPKIDRFVAVKTISLSSQDPRHEREYRDRFFHEAQAAGRLLHPGIVTIFDTGDEPDGHIAYIVMEYIAGRSLEQLLSEHSKKLPLDAALLLTGELAEALDHAHGQGVVHRDMKPANILVTPEGHAKIADFGIAKMNLAYLTLPGQSLGTPAYMSPEQLEGEPVDKRSDLFSLGAILYRMVTGYGPFQGNSVTTVCFKVANREPLRASAINPDLPPELDAVIGRAMAKDPAERYQRGLQFALDLHELRERCRVASKGPKSVSPFSRAGEAVARSDRDATTVVSSAASLPVGFVESGSSAARRVLSFASRRALLWWRLPVVRAGFVLAVAAIILTLVAYHRSHASRSSSQTPLPVVASGETGPVANAPQTAEPNIGKVSDPNAPPKAAADATLDIHIEHRFAAADLSLWVDDKLAYDHPLRGQPKKHWNPFRTDVQETEIVRLASGKHHLRVRVRSDAEKYEQSATISGNFVKGHPTTLKINFERQGKAMRLALR